MALSGALKQMSPKDGYVVSSKAHIGSTEFKVVLKLYQPLMGVNAYGVYSILAVMASREPNLLERKMHKNLLDILGLGLRDFYDARIRLEALGLLRTFEQEDDLGRLFIYELQAPLSAPEFFQDDLLSILLCDFLGKERYEELQKEFIVAKFTHPQAKETTKSLLDVFTVGRESLLQAQETKKNISKTPKMIARVDFELDMETLQALVARSFVPDKELIRCEDTLKTIALLYGLDEPALLHLLEQALDVNTNQVDQEVLKKSAATQFSCQVQANPKKEADLVEKTEAVPAVEVKLSANDQTLANVCRAYLPLEFIEVLKQQKNSFVTNLEQYTVKNLVEKQVLPNAVINVLLHYYLIVQNNAVLESKVANRFTAAAAKLAEEKIQTPEEAMAYMRKANQQATAEKNKRQQTYYAKKRTVIQKETLPDWAKETESDKKDEAKENGLSKEKRAALNAEIDELFAELEKGESK